MGIRTKLIGAIILPIIIVLAVVSGAVYLQMNKTVDGIFFQSANQQLVLVQNYVNKILESARNTSAFVASLPEARGAMGKWTRYFEQSEPTLPGAVATDPGEILLNRLANDLMKSHPDFAYVYMGFKDGGYTQDGKEIIAVDYDPRKRPWYTESMASSAPTTLLSAYITTMGVPNIGVTSKILDADGKPIGVSAVDISLGNLTKIIEGIKIGKTGYVMLIQGDGTILSDPKNKDRNFKKIGELDNPSLLRIGESQGGKLTDLSIDGTEYIGCVLKSQETGWTLAALMEKSEVSAASHAAIFKVIFIGCIAVLVFGAMGGLYVNKGIIGPVKKAIVLAQSLARGDLTKSIDVHQKDEIGDLADALRNMAAQIKQVVGEVQAVTDNVASGSEQLSASSEQLSQGATEQAATVEEISSSTEEMGANIRQNTDNALQTEKISVQAAGDAGKTGSAVDETVVAMKNIAEKISVIEEIARNTNLLALNAAIEAARAGEAGKGFAVVAAEVRKLAENSGKAAAEISDLSTSSVHKAENAGKMLRDIVPDIQKTADLIQEIAAASKEQNIGADQINQAVQQVDQVIQQNASAAEEMAATSAELSSQAAQLQATIAFFNTGEMRQPSSSREPHPKNNRALPGSRPTRKSAATGSGIDLNMKDDVDDSEFERF